MIDLIMQ